MQGADFGSVFMFDWVTVMPVMAGLLQEACGASSVMSVMSVQCLKESLLGCQGQQKRLCL
jgi:hypothetical protein